MVASGPSGAHLESDELHHPPSTRARVLIVDDEAALRRSMLRLLRAKGYLAEAASNGLEALELFRERSFDVVLSDITMPGCDGLELLCAIQRIQPSIPVVLVTGSPSLKGAVTALEYGAFHYLTKPVDLLTLQRVLDRATCQRYLTEMTDRAVEISGRKLELQLPRSIEVHFDRVVDTLWPAYQPIVRSGDGTVYGYEALLRCDAPGFGSPLAVLDVAERLGRLHTVGRKMRQLAAAGMQRTSADAHLFVNLHASNVFDTDLGAAQCPLLPIANRTVLEITERAAFDKLDDARERLKELKSVGFKIAVDDLGSGYAGLTSLTQLEPDIVKLDMALVRDVDQSVTRQKLIRSVGSLCRDMGMVLVAEGVETEPERETLRDLGCDLLQGFLIARPERDFPDVNW